MKITLDYTDSGWRATCGMFPLCCGRGNTANLALTLLLEECKLCAFCGCIEWEWTHNRCSNCGEMRSA